MGYLTLNEPGLIQEANLTAAHLLGVARAKLLRQPLTRFILREDLDIFDRHRQRLFETRAPQSCELRLTRPDGAPLWVRGQAILAQDPGTGAPVCRMTLSDLTERKQAEAALKKTEDHLRLVLDTTPALIHTGRPDGYLDYFNQRWLEYVGLSLADLQGWGWTARIHPEDVEGAVNRWRASLASGEPFEHEARVRRANGQYRWMLHRKVPLRDEHGNIVKWYGSGTDIEDRKRAEDALRASEERYRRLFEAMDEGFCIVEMLYAPGGKPVDYRFVEINPAFEKRTGTPTRPGQDDSPDGSQS